MSFLFSIFYWVGLPLLIIFAVAALLRLKTGRTAKGIIVTFGLGAVAWLLWIAVGETWMLDRQVRELCAKDGGIKVYETVPLPPELMDKYGIIRVPTKEKATVDDQYYRESEKFYYLKGRLQMSRSEYRIIRKSDKKVLGKMVLYGRGGGGLPGPWHGSSFNCRDIMEIFDYEKLVFLKGDKK